MRLAARMLFAVVASASAGVAHAGPLDDLRDALRQLGNSTPVRAQLERQLTDVAKGDDDRNGETSAVASIDGDGLHVVFGGDVLRRAEQEHALRDPDAPRPASRGLRSIDPVDVRAMLGYSKRLLADLDEATLVSDTTSTYERVPARLLEISVPVKLDKGDRKHVKEAHSTMKLWCGADGLPLALEQRTQLKGRVFLVIGFEVHDSRTLRFARSGDRLLVLHSEVSNGGSGLGEAADHSEVTTLKLL